MPRLGRRPIAANTKGQGGPRQVHPAGNISLLRHLELKQPPHSKELAGCSTGRLAQDKDAPTSVQQGEEVQVGKPASTGQDPHSVAVDAHYLQPTLVQGSGDLVQSEVLAVNAVAVWVEQLRTDRFQCQPEGDHGS
jgi:hypothetical protein